MKSGDCVGHPPGSAIANSTKQTNPTCQEFSSQIAQSIFDSSHPVQQESLGAAMMLVAFKNPFGTSGPAVGFKAELTAYGRGNNVFMDVLYSAGARLLPGGNYLAHTFALHDFVKGGFGSPEYSTWDLQYYAAFYGDEAGEKVGVLLSKQFQSKNLSQQALTSGIRNILCEN